MEAATSYEMLVHANVHGIISSNNVKSLKWSEWHWIWRNGLLTAEKQYRFNKVLNECDTSVIEWLIEQYTD